MHIIEVIPLTMLPPNVPQILSYFFDEELPKGSVVEIPFNKRKIKAVVLSSSSLEKEKLSLKNVDFQIKKISKVVYNRPQISDFQFKIAVWIAKSYHAPLGYTLKTILPPFVFKKKYPLTVKNEIIPPVRSRARAFGASPEDRGAATSNGVHKNPLTMFNIVNPRLLIYKTKRLVEHLEPLIKNLDDTKQVLIMVPEKALINYFLEYFSKEYETSSVHSGLSNEILYESWQNAESGKTKIVVGTRQALNMSFKDLGLIIIDDPLHEFYKSDMTPRYNAVALAHKVSELNNAQFIMTSVVPGVINYYKSKKGTYDLKEIEPRPKFNTEIIDMAQEIKNSNWSPISKKLNEKLLTCLKNGKKALIFSSRRGYAGILICGNCGSAVKCPQCEVAMRTHRSVEMILACHRCGISKSIPKNCPVCGNYNLKTVGPAGTQKIYDEIRIRLAAAGVKANVLALDTDIVKNKTEEDEIISEILAPHQARPSSVNKTDWRSAEKLGAGSKQGPSVLVATQAVFAHRFYLNFELIAVANADALTNMPDFKSEENLFYQIEKLVNFLPERTSDSVELLVQTHNPENKLTEKAVQGKYNDFYENELKIRETLNYPPFCRLIKLTFRHKDKEKASYAARVTSEKLKMAVARARLGEKIKIIEAVPAYIEKEKNLYLFNIFLKVREDYDDIGELLRYVGPGWTIDIDPRSLL